MKKGILNIGKELNKAEQKQINGGTPYCGGYPTLALCNFACVFGSSTCEYYACSRTEHGYFCVESGGSQ